MQDRIGCTMTITATLAAVIIVLTGCDGPAAPPPAAPSPAQQASVTACQHYRTQRAWVKSITNPTLAEMLADAARFQADLDLDQDDATPGTPLFRDLVTFSTDESENLAAIGGTGKTVSVEVIPRRVMADCEALGVAF